MEPEELESFRNMKPVQIMVSARDYMQLQDAINNPSEPNEALKKAAQRFREGFTLRGRAFDPAIDIPYDAPITPELLRKVLGDPMQGISLIGRMPTVEEERAVHDYLTEHLGDQFQGVSLIVPESKLEEEVRKF